jgi:hypothetical protein
MSQIVKPLAVAIHKSAVPLYFLKGIGTAINGVCRVHRGGFKSAQLNSVDTCFPKRLIHMSNKTESRTVIPQCESPDTWCLRTCEGAVADDKTNTVRVGRTGLGRGAWAGKRGKRGRQDAGCHWASGGEF